MDTRGSIAPCARPNRLGRLRARGGALIERLVPPGADADTRRRSYIVITFTVIVVSAVIVCMPADAMLGNWVAVGLALVGGAVAVAMLALLRRGHVRLTAHVDTGLFMFALLGIAASKGGVAAPEIGWLTAAVVFSVLAHGPRGGLVWTGVAIAGLFVHAIAFDPSHVGSATPAFSDPIAFGFDHGVLFLVIWGLAVAFDRARTEYMAKLTERTVEMRRVLEHSREGLLTIDRDGRIAAERSARAEALLGPIEDGALLWDVIGRRDPRFGSMLEVGWQSVLDDVLPRELALEQMPKRLCIDARVLELEVIVIESGDTITGALIALHDITDELSRERAERANRDQLEVFKHARVDPAAVVTFVQEMDRLADAIGRGGDVPVLLRDIHTMKGNAGLFGVRAIAELCHDIEQRAANADGTPSDDDRAMLAGAWADVSRELAGWVDAGEAKKQFDVRFEDILELERAIEARARHTELGRMLGAWRLAPMDRLLGRLARQADALAQRLGKRVRIEVDPTNVRVDADAMAPILSALVHVVRNAIDHGIEAEEERVVHGKPAAGTLRFAARFEQGMLEIEIADDGKGVDWEAVRGKAAARGVTAPGAPLSELLFADGFSTRENVTALSGRGVGLGAVRSAARSVGGEAAIDSQPGAGSRFRVSVPIAYATGLGGCPAIGPTFGRTRASMRVAPAPRLVGRREREVEGDAPTSASPSGPPPHHTAPRTGRSYRGSRRDRWG